MKGAKQTTLRHQVAGFPASACIRACRSRSHFIRLTTTGGSARSSQRIASGPALSNAKSAPMYARGYRNRICHRSRRCQGSLCSTAEHLLAALCGSLRRQRRRRNSTARKFQQSWTEAPPLSLMRSIRLASQREHMPRRYIEVLKTVSVDLATALYGELRAMRSAWFPGRGRNRLPDIR